MSKKSIKWIVFLIIVLGAFYLLFFKGKDKLEVIVNSDKVIRESLFQKVSATGTINPVQTVEVGTQVSGRIDKLFVDFNDVVKVGDVIAKMDIRNLVASVNESKANLLRAEVQMNQTKRNLERTKQLYEKEAASLVEYEKTQDDYELAKANYNSAKLQLERNQVNLGYATITSPIDGVIISRKVDEGQTVAATFSTPAMFVIAKDLKKMKIEASVDEADIGQVKKGQKVSFYVDAFQDKTFEGIVEEIQLQPVTIQNVVTYTVEILVDNPELILMPGMTATLDIIISSEENKLTIPNGVFKFEMTKELENQILELGYKVNRLEKESAIWKYDSSATTFTQVEISKGFSNDIKTIVSGNIKEGDEIVNSAEVEVVDLNKGKSFLMPQRPGSQNKEKK